MTSCLARAILLVLVAAASVSAQGPGFADLKQRIDRLSSFDFAERTDAARALRRAAPSDIVPALIDAAQHHSDQFVRYRALVLLTAFNDRRTPDLMRSLLPDRNDRVREVVYRWFEQHPDPALSATLMAAIETEQAEFVRPALIRALAALPYSDRLQRALVAEAGRGFDFFRSAVIESLGEHHADFAVEAIVSIALVEGPLQDDAVLALGRIGGSRASSVLSTLTNPSAELAPAAQAAQCLIGRDCPERIEWLTKTAQASAARAETVRAALAALSALTSQDNRDAAAALVALSISTSDLRDEVGVAYSAAALRNPDVTLEWLANASAALQVVAIDLLHSGFERLEEDFAEEQFFAAARAAYWAAGEGSATRVLMATVIDKLEF